MALPQTWLDQLKSRTTLSALIGRSVKLQRAGNEYRACCPFHQEKSPSFYVNDAKGFYHCFGCQAHGGAIDWLMQSRGLAFMEAVKELAVQAGMDLPAPDPALRQREEQRAGLHDVCAAAQEWFRANLESAAGAVARDYLALRGIGPEAAATFGFGYAPDRRDGLRSALARFGDAILIEAGLLVAVEGREPYDRFRDRLMLPIQDARGQVIGFGGRLLQARDGAPKYLNSPDTPLFDKGRTLYNLNRAGPAARKIGRLIVVEGYMDAVALAQAGIAEVVAPMGTALTEAQIEAMWRIVDKPILCFDGDTAGRRAALRAAERALPLLRPGLALQFVTLPPGLDPDDLVRQHGRAAIEPLLSAPQSLADCIWQHELEAGPLTAPEDKAGLKARLLAYCDMMAHRDLRALFRREWLDRFGTLAFPSRPQRQPGDGKGWKTPQCEDISGPRTALARLSARDSLLAAVLQGLARHTCQIDRHADALLRIAPAQGPLADALEALLKFAEQLESGNPAPISSMQLLKPRADIPRYSFLQEGVEAAIAHQDLAEAVAVLVERPALEAAIAAATARFDVDPDAAFREQQRLRKRKLEIERRLGQMARDRAAPAAMQDNGNAAAGLAAGGQMMD